MQKQKCKCCSRVLCITDPIRLNLPNNETEKSFAAHIVPLHTESLTFGHQFTIGLILPEYQNEQLITKPIKSSDYLSRNNETEKIYREKKSNMKPSQKAERTCKGCIKLSTIHIISMFLERLEFFIPRTCFTPITFISNNTTAGRNCLGIGCSFSFIFFVVQSTIYSGMFNKTSIIFYFLLLSSIIKNKGSLTEEKRQFPTK